MSGNYNFGVAKVGAAMEVDNTMTGKLEMSNVVVAVPVGAWKFSANYTWTKVSDLNNALDVFLLRDGTHSGYGLVAEYALSKRSKVVLNYANWNPYVGSASNDTETNILLSHSF